MPRPFIRRRQGHIPRFLAEAKGGPARNPAAALSGGRRIADMRAKLEGKG